MDRFIDSLAGAWYGYGRNLKSNMDRFIALQKHPHPWACKDLKSNMDRFIEHSSSETRLIILNLKSNMDRFIGCAQPTFIA